MEIAVAHGYASVRVKGFAEKLALERRTPRQRRKSQDWVAGLMALSGARNAGKREAATADSPVAGVTPESFRAEVAAMRTAEYERARERKNEPN